MDTLLAYSITTNPFPLQASAQSGNPNVAQLTVVVSNNSGSDITLQGIIVKIPVGQGASQLTNDAKDIGAVPPDNWTLKDTQFPAGYVQYLFRPNTGYETLSKNTSLNFIFNNIQVNTQTGPVEIDVTEGSKNCTPPNCPIAQLSITKFPNSWGQVSFWVDHLDIPAGNSDTLHWSGPSGATYTIEYYDALHGSIVNVPAQGDPPLSNQGQYPAQGAPPLTLQQTTTFSLSVAETIGGQSYHAQTQITVTVQIPPPVINSFTAVPSDIDMNNPSTSKLTWNTSNVSLIKIDGVGSFTDAQAANGSCPVAPMGTVQYFATAYGLSGYLGHPVTANTWLNFVGTASSGFLDVWNDNGGVLWSLSLGQGRNVFTLNLQVKGEDRPGQEQDFDVVLSLQPGVQIANLGNAREGAGYAGVLNGSYGTSLPMSHVWGGYTMNLSDDVFGEQPDNVGATWGVKFSDGLFALLWLDNVYPSGYDYGIHQWAFVFKWIFYNSMHAEEAERKE